MQRLVLVFALFMLLGTALAQDDWAQLGQETFDANCAACHQASGEGVPAAFPPLAGHLPDVVAADGGRQYLIHVLLYGLQGEIDVNGATYNGVMPAWAQFSDEQIAAVLNYALHSWGNDEMLPEGFEPLAADEIAAERDLGLSADDVHAQREALGLDGAE